MRSEDYINMSDIISNIYFLKEKKYMSSSSFIREKEVKVTGKCNKSMLASFSQLH